MGLEAKKQTRENERDITWNMTWKPSLLKGDLNYPGGPQSSTGKLVWGGIPEEPINPKHYALSPLA